MKPPLHLIVRFRRSCRPWPGLAVAAGLSVSVCTSAGFAQAANPPAPAVPAKTPPAETAPAAASDYDSNGQSGDVKALESFVVTEAPVQRFANGNADFPRTINDAQPYYIFNATDLEESGAADLEDFLKQKLSMDNTFQSANETYSSGIGNASSIDIRGLGVGQTLVLINGRRIQGVTQLSADVYGNQPDINGIPQSAVERIDVLPSSASGIYGASAAGGVINVILKKSYNGGEVKYTRGSPFDTDAPSNSVSATFGAGYKGTRVMISASYSDQAPMFNQDRPQLAFRGLNIIRKNNPLLIDPAGIPYMGATTNIVLDPVVSNGYTNPQNTTLTLKDGTSLHSTSTYIAPGTSPGTPTSALYASLLANAGQQNYNLAPYDGKQAYLGQILTVASKKSLTATVTQQITKNIEWFEEFYTGSNYTSFDNNHIDSLTTNTAEFIVPGNAPNSPFQENVLVKFPFNAQTPSTTSSVTSSIVSGFDATLPGDWHGEFDYTWSQNMHSYTSIIENLATDAFPSMFAKGIINPFVDTGIYPLQDLTPYMTRNRFYNNSNLNDVALRGSGPVYHLPWGRPTLSIGLERRLQGSHNAQNYALNALFPNDTNVIDYFGRKTITYSEYGEMWLPIVTRENARPFVNALDFQFAVRNEKADADTGTPYVTSYPTASPAKASVYAAPTTTTGGYFKSTAHYKSTNPTIAMRYSPTKDFLIRSSYSTAFIPPTSTQLVGNPNRGINTTIVDPQNGKTYGTDTISGGNPNLKPQNTTNVDAGIVWSPQSGALKGVRLDLEYFYIKETDVISSLTGQVIVNDPSLASHVTRDPATGLITLIDGSLMNLLYFDTSGWDVSGSYRKATPAGTFTFNAMVTFVDHYRKKIAPGTPELEYAGYPSFGGPVKTRGNATLAWSRNGLRLGWTTRYFSSYGQYGAPGSPYYTSPTIAPFTLYTLAQGSNSVPSQMYHDVFASYTFGDAGRNRYLSGLVLQLKVTDVFNKVPPFDAYYGPNYFSPPGDYRLRAYQVSLTKRF